MATSFDRALRTYDKILRRQCQYSRQGTSFAEKKEEFSQEAIQVLILAPSCHLTYAKFTQWYTILFKRPVKVLDYGCSSLMTLFSSVPETVTYGGSWVQLTESIRSDAARKRKKYHPNLALLENELVQLRNVLEGRRITMTMLCSCYERRFGRQFKAADFGYSRMKHMLELLPHLVEIEDTKPHATITLLPQPNHEDESTSTRNGEESTESEEESAQSEENNTETESDEEGTESISFALKCVEVPDKGELVAEFAEECVELLMATETRSMSLRKFRDMYLAYFEKQCRATDYGFKDLEELFGAIPNIVKITGEKGSRFVKRYCRVVQLTSSATLIGMDLPELSDSLEVIDV